MNGAQIFLSKKKKLGAKIYAFFKKLHFFTLFSNYVIFKVDESSGDLQIYHNSVCILSYNKAEGHWIIGSIDLNNFITEVDEYQRWDSVTFISTDRNNQGRDYHGYNFFELRVCSCCDFVVE